MTAMAHSTDRSRRRGRQETEQLLDSFLEALATPQVQSIPQETVLGAITHFLSTLPASDLPHFVEAILGSDSLWSPKFLEDGKLRQAIAVAVQAKVAHIETTHKSAWLANRRISRECRRWLHVIQVEVDKHAKTNETSRTLNDRDMEARIGLLAGVQACEAIDWQDERMALEEELVMTLAELDFQNVSPGSFILVCEAVNLIEPIRLAVLDLHALLVVFQNELLASTKERSTTLPAIRVKLAAAVARLYTVYASDRQSSAHLDRLMAAFVAGIRQQAELNEAQLGRKGAAKLSDRQWDMHKSFLSAFLTPASAMIDTILNKEDMAASRNADDHARLASGIIETLTAFSYITEQVEGGLENHDRVLFGALDILEVTAGGHGLAQLFEAIITAEISANRAAFALRVAEQLIGTVDGRTMREILLPLCERYLHSTEDVQSFEAAHAFMLAVITQAGKANDRPLPQYDFLMELIPVYSRVLLKQYTHSKISADRLKSAYAATTEVASKTDDFLAQQCIDQLDTIKDSSSDKEQTLLLVRISLAPFVPILRLRDYLDNLARDIVETPAGEGRLELAAKAFGMVLHDLGDDRKKMGIEWWLKWKREIEGRTGPTAVTAKL